MIKTSSIVREVRSN